jgi:NAD-dependent SIR2 family protein deacetylase
MAQTATPAAHLPGTLWTYQCRNCKTVMTTTVRRTTATPPYRCNLCWSYMREMWSEPITTGEQKALAARGIVYNPYGRSAR